MHTGLQRRKVASQLLGLQPDGEDARPGLRLLTATELALPGICATCARLGGSVCRTLLTSRTPQFEVLQCNPLALSFFAEASLEDVAKPGQQARHVDL